MNEADETRHSAAGEQSEPARTPPKKPRTRLRRLIRTAVLLYAVWLTLLFVGQRWIVFPDYLTPEPSAAEKYDSTTVVLRRDIGDSAGDVIAWYVPSDAARRGKPSPLVVYLHGNAEIIDSQGDAIELYRLLGCSVLLPEFRSYGRSKGGRPSEKALVEDAVWFLDEVKKRPEVDASRIVIHGRSMGGGVAAQLAARRQPKALILGSTFTSLAPFAHRYLAPAFLLRSQFRTDAVLPTLDIPVLIHHGTRDNIVPVEHGRRLRDLAKRATLIELDCMHNDFPGEGNQERYEDDIRAFLVEHGVIEQVGNKGLKD